MSILVGIANGKESDEPTRLCVFGCLRGLSNEQWGVAFAVASDLFRAYDDRI